MKCGCSFVLDVDDRVFFGLYFALGSNVLLGGHGNHRDSWCCPGDWEKSVNNLCSGKLICI